MAEKPVFKYHSLPEPGFIRVLYIHPIPEGGKDDKNVVGSMVAVPPANADKVEYTALSYHWGDQSNKLPIYLSNTGFLETYDQASNFWVTESLHDALVQLRRNHYLLPGDSKHALWIDAICIDQDNIEERNEQVRRMGDIYQKAALIYIWLGPEENNSQLAWSKITVVVDNVRRFPFDRRQHTYNSWKDMHAGMMTAVVNPSWGGLESKGHEAMCHLLSRPWWTRAWIVQESTIPDVDAIVCCGKNWEKWGDFQGGILMIWEVLRRARLPSTCRWFNIIDLRTFRRIREDIQFLPPTRRLAEILEWVRGYEVSNPRDLVYAFIAMAHIEHRAFSIDYNKSVVDVWVDTAKFLIHNLPWGHQLDFLSWNESVISRGNIHKTEAPKIEGLPSWAPDFRFKSGPCPFSKSTKPFCATPYYNAGLGFDSSGNSAQEIFLEYRNNWLVVHSVEIGKILYTYPFYDIQSIRDIDLPNKQAEYIPTGESVREAFERTKMSGVRLNSDGNRAERNGECTASQEETPWTPYLDGIKEHWIESACKGRKFAWIEGGYMGLVPWLARTGDVVHVLVGGQMLYALRFWKDNLEEKEFEFIGEVYVHGLMDGEVMELLRTGQATLERILIR